MIRSRLADIAAAFALVVALAADAAMPNLAKPMNTDSPIDISADNFTVQEGGWVTATGNVLVRQADSQITADTIKVNKSTGEIVAEGNVILVREGQGATRSDRLEFNYKTGEGVTPGLDVEGGPFRVISKESRRLADGSYLLNDVQVTTCTNDPSSFHYCVHAANALFMPEQFVVMNGASSYFMGVPFFYFPKVKRSLVDHFGWRFVPGYETDWGAYLLSTYKRQLVDFGGEHHDSLDSYTHIDYRTERGFALGEDIGWHFGDSSQGGHYGRIGIYGIFDDDPMNEDFDREPQRDEVEDTRYRATLAHKSTLTESDTLAIRTSFFSDSYVMEDFYEDEFKELGQPESYATYTHIDEGWSGGIGVYQRANKFYDAVNRLPEIWLDVMNTQIGQTPFYYESESSGGFLKRDFADYDNSDNTVADSYDSLRVDTRHTIYLPEKFFGFLSVVPRAAYRGTYYGTTYNEVKEEHFDGTNTTVSTRYDDDGSGLRSLFELGFETSFKAYGLYEDEAGRIRHIVEPYINYTFIPEPNLRPFELPQFDSIDKLDKANFARVGLRQYLQRKVDNKTVNRIDADIYGIYDIEDAHGESGLRTLGIDSEFRPTDSIKVELDATYDANESEIDYVDLWMTLWQGDRWEAAGEFYYRPDICAQYTGALKFNFSEQWGAKIYARFDSELSRMEEISGYLQYNLDCLSFRLRGSYEPSFTRDDGTEREAKFKVAFYTWVRAFTPSRYERKLRDRYFE
ncbi:MAG: LPS-assembly protein LptD [Kiritimatiellae bacterium]|nr:LPS-assembly protein LptD [Kiritimatiellia bacterium]